MFTYLVGREKSSTDQPLKKISSDYKGRNPKADSSKLSCSMCVLYILFLWADLHGAIFVACDKLKTCL